MKKEEILSLIKELNLPKIIEDIFHGKDLPKEIKYSFGLPKEFFILTDEELKPYKVDVIKPLFDDGNFGKIYAYNIHKKGFLTYYADEPIDNLLEEPVYSWDAIFIPRILSWYDNELEDEVILNLGEAFNLKYIKEIISEIKVLENQGAPWEEVKAWEKRKIKELQ